MQHATCNMQHATLTPTAMQVFCNSKAKWPESEADAEPEAEPEAEGEPESDSESEQSR